MKMAIHSISRCNKSRKWIIERDRRRLEYVPNQDFVGEDSFTWLANDGEADSNIATLAITVTNINDIPVANDDVFTLSQESVGNMFLMFWQTIAMSTLSLPATV